jgi:APA family basic amino acid/polyamine antiporter
MQQTIGLQPPVAVAPKGHLLRVFGMAFALAISIGGTIGSGILGVPGEVAGHLPSAPWIMAVWLLGGVNALLGATAYSELGAMIPCAGGPYVFARRALGEYAGFFVGYVDWISNCAGDATIALLAGQYAARLLPSLAGHAPTIAATAIVAIVALNWFQVRVGGWIQKLATLAKVLSLGALVVVAFALPHPDVTATAAAPAIPSGIALFAALALAMQGVVWTYQGYYFPVYFGEELRNPGREIPRAMFRGLYLVIGLYLLLNAAFLWVIPMGALAHDPFPGGSVARILFGANGDRLITSIVVVSLIGSVNDSVLTAPRIALALGRDRLFPPQAAHVNRGGTPDVALGVTALAMLGFLLTGTFASALAVTTALVVVQYSLMFVSVFVLRRREPGTPRPYRAWGYPWTTVIALAASLVFLVGVAKADPVHSWIALAILIASYPLYRGVAALRGKAAVGEGTS